MAAIMSANVTNALAVVVATVVVYHVLKFVRNALWEPLRLRRIMAKQGIEGPPFRLLLGFVMETEKITQSFPDNLPMNDFANLSPTVTPQYASYFPKYGKMFVYRWGPMTRLVVRDPEIVKELMITNHESLTRSELHQFFSVVIGKGLLSLGGEKWILERRTINPFFHQDALKAMVGAIRNGAAPEIQKWENMVADGGGEAEIDVEPDLHKISGRIISRTAFGDDFKIGEHIYRNQQLIGQQLLKTLRTKAYWLVPGYRRIPTKGNRLMDHLSSEVDALLRGLISDRRKMDSFGNDLLGRMLAAASEGWSENTQEFNLASVFNNCKLFYFAGQDTVANAICFALLMLALHPEWQDRTRKEVLEVYDDTAAALPHLKLVGMVLNETLRLFPPVYNVARLATKDVHLKGGLFIPKGMAIEFPILAIHQDKEYWGDAVGEFNPGRFVNGVSEACSHKQAFFPFGAGPKNCIGNNFAVMEAKIVLASVLRRFQLLPSPNYKHHPIHMLVQRPKFGMPIIFKAL
jgi:cytochrome P450